MSEVFDAQLTGTRNETLYTSYRVVIYRPIIDGSFSDANGKLFPLNDILIKDPSDTGYMLLSKRMSNDKVFFNSFLKNLCINIQANVSKDAILEEIDITPIVSKLDISLNIEGINTCNIVSIDPKIIVLDKNNLDRFLENNEWYGQLNSKNSLKEKILSFKFREFDIVRIYTYANKDQSVAERMEYLLQNSDSIWKQKNKVAIEKRDKLIKLRAEPIFYDYTLIDSQIEALTGEINANEKPAENSIREIAFDVAFTGVVSSMMRTNSVDNTSNISVQCLGLSRYLTQTSLILNQTAANSLALGLGDFVKVLSTDGSPFNWQASEFSGKNVLDIIVYIMGLVFHPSEIGSDIDGASNAGVGVASILYVASLLNSYTKDGEVHWPVIQFLPNLITLHALKEKFKEPIYFSDDAYTSKEVFADDYRGMRERSPSDWFKETQLKTYLLMIRDSYENIYDPTFVSPLGIFEDTRRNSFLEFFEDRSGTFRYRMPRYNKVNLDSYCGPYDTTSAQIISSDSNNFCIVQSRPMVPTLGALREISPRVFADKLSAFRYGLRATPPMENPNATSVTMAKIIAEFTRYYEIGRNSRTAIITKLADPSINIGDLIGFRLSYEGMDGDFLKNEYINDCYVGYVQSIREDISVDGAYHQTLTLTHVREAGLKYGTGRIYDYLMPVYLSKKFAKLDSSGGVLNQICSKFISGNNYSVLGQNDFVNCSNNIGYQARFSRFADMFDLLDDLSLRSGEILEELAQVQKIITEGNKSVADSNGKAVPISVDIESLNLAKKSIASSINQDFYQMYVNDVTGNFLTFAASVDGSN